MLVVGPVSSVFDILTFLLLWYVFGANTPARQSLFQSGWFVESLLTQTLIIHMIRTAKVPFLESRATWPVNLLTASVVAIAMLIPFLPYSGTLGFVPLPGSFFVWLLAVTAGYVMLTQAVKRWYIHRFGTWL
jgi:Mg2+-importing ATPase